MDVVSSTTMEHLPEELLADVLRRLSPKAALRCKCVSNRWKTIISRYDFAQNVDRIHAEFWELALIKNAYLRKDRLKPKINLHLTLSLCYSYLQYSIELPLPRSFHFSSDLKPYLCATDNGLLLFDLADYRPFGSLHAFYLCNPLTKQWITIPSVDLIDGHSYGLICKRRCNELNGELETRFRVLRVPLGSLTNTFKVFSSDSGQWSQFHSVVPFLLSDRSLKNFVYKGMIYWRKLDGGFVGFDPFEINDTGYCRTRIIDEPNNSNIPGLAILPRSFVANSPGLQVLIRNSVGLTSSEVLDTVGVSQGRLRMSQLFGSHRERPQWYPILRVWELNDDEDDERQTGSGSKWWLVHEVDINEIACQHRLFPPHVEDDVCAVALGFHPNDNDIVVMWLNEFIVFCNIQKRTMKIVDVLREERQKIDYDCLAKCCWFPCWPYPVTAPLEPF